jgi:hypothetical protein
VYGFSVFILVVSLSGFQITPGLGFIDLGWEADTYLNIAAIAGGVAGFLGADLRLSGTFAGALIGLGGLLAIPALLSFLPMLPNIVVVFAMLAGFMPGVGCYWLADRLLKGRTGEMKSSDCSAG